MLLSPAYNSFALGRGIHRISWRQCACETFWWERPVSWMCVALELVVSLGVLVWRLDSGLAIVSFHDCGRYVCGDGQLSIANWSALSFPKKWDRKMKGQRNSGVRVDGVCVQILIAGIATVVFAGRPLARESVAAGFGFSPG